MVTTVHFAYAEAYERKDGGFRCFARNKLTGETYTSNVLETLAEAKCAAVATVFAWADGRNMTTGTYRNSAMRWRCNYFIRSDEKES